MSPAPLTTDDIDPSQRIFQTRQYDVTISSSFPKNAKDTYSYTLTSEHMPSSTEEDSDLRSHRFKKNNDFYRTSVRSVSNNSYFFPTTGLYDLNCFLVNMTYECEFGNSTSVEGGVSRIEKSRDSFRTTLLLADKNTTHSTLVVMGISDWTPTDVEDGSVVAKEPVNATCTDVYTQVRYFVMAGQLCLISFPL
jgi:hypothetical protein